MPRRRRRREGRRREGGREGGGYDVCRWDGVRRRLMLLLLS